VTRNNINPFRRLHPLLKILVPIVGFIGGWLLVSLPPLTQVEFGIGLSRGQVLDAVFVWIVVFSPVYLPLIVLALWAANRAASRLSTHILVSSSVAFWPLVIFTASTINEVVRNGEALRAAVRIANDDADPIWGLLAGLVSSAATELFHLVQRAFHGDRQEEIGSTAQAPENDGWNQTD